MIDSHCHLDFAQFDHDRDVVIASARELGVHTFLVPGVKADNWQPLIDLNQQYPHVRFALGLHPYFLEDYRSQHLAELESLLLAHRNTVSAVGEIGLDFAIARQGTAGAKLQIEVFSQQLYLARKSDLPVVVHHRQSHNDTIRHLKQAALPRGGVIHAFSGSYQIARDYIDMGFKLGVGGTITYPRAGKTRGTIQKLPLDALLLETDSPDMPVAGRQGLRNSPENLPIVLDTLAELRTESREEIERVTDLNFAALFARRDLHDDVVAQKDR